ncbi:MAG: polysaccharide export protein [Desulfobacteraceae bacterium]|nr:polysaccharide export protein [Desulfobacteraceae bacterium]
MKKTLIVYLASTLMAIFIIGNAKAQNYPYELGPGDIVEISVWKDESLSRTLIVPPDGVIAFPLIGDIKIKSMTIENLRSKVTQLLAAYIPDATVTVILVELKSLNAFVIGKVNKPGNYSITMDTTVIQLLSMAGGLNPFADENKIHIFRRINNKTIKIPFDYSQVLKGNNLEQNIVLKRGDVVVVP